MCDTLKSMLGIEQDYPTLAGDILEAAEDLDALPFNPEPLSAQGSGLPCKSHLTFKRHAGRGAGLSSTCQGYLGSSRGPQCTAL